MLSWQISSIHHSEFDQHTSSKLVSNLPLSTNYNYSQTLLSKINNVLLGKYFIIVSTLLHGFTSSEFSNLSSDLFFWLVYFRSTSLFEIWKLQAFHYKKYIGIYSKFGHGVVKISAFKPCYKLKMRTLWIQGRNHKLFYTATNLNFYKNP